MLLGRWSRAERAALQAIAAILGAIWLIPTVAAVSVSLRGDGLENYLSVLTLPLLQRMLLNSTLLAAITVAGVYVVAGVTAYALSKLEIRGADAIYLAVLAALLVPSVGVAVAIFTAVRLLGLTNNLLGVAAPLIVLLAPFYTVICRAYLDGLPREIIDAARIDGASPWAVLWWIIRPLAAPVAAVVVVGSFLGAWNMFFIPFLVLTDPEMQVAAQAPLVLRGPLDYMVDHGRVFASYIVVSLPVVLVYLAMQRTLERGLFVRP